jgi:hypothetical protein
MPDRPISIMKSRRVYMSNTRQLPPKKRGLRDTRSRLPSFELSEANARPVSAHLKQRSVPSGIRVAVWPVVLRHQA